MRHHLIALGIGAAIGFYFAGTLKTYPVFSNINGLVNSRG